MLPPEIVYTLAESLGSRELASLQATSSYMRQLLYKHLWRDSHLVVKTDEGAFESEYLESPATDRVLECVDIAALADMVEYEQYSYPLQELRYLTIQCANESSQAADLARFLSLAQPSMFGKLQQINVFTTVRTQQPTLLLDFVQRFENVGANLYIDAQKALDAVLMPSNVRQLVLSTIKGCEGFDLHEVIQSHLLSNVESLHLVTDKNHPIAKGRLISALENSKITHLAVTPHCVECDDENLHWTLPESITKFELHVPSFDQEWSPSLGSITSDNLTSLRVPSNGENRLYNMRFPNLVQLHLEGTQKDAFRLPPGIGEFCECSTKLEQLQLSGFSMSDVAQIVQQFQTSLRSVVLRNTVKTAREYNLYQWNFLPNLESLVVDYSMLTHNVTRVTRRLLEALPRTVKMYIIDHKDCQDESLWCHKLETPVINDDISSIDLLDGVDRENWSAYGVNLAEFHRQAAQVEN